MKTKLFTVKKFLTKITKIFFTIFLFVGLFGCEQTKNDETLAKNIGKALEARWNITDKISDTVSNEEYRKQMANAIDKEKNKIGDLEEYTFSDSNIKDYANSYLEGLLLQEESLQYYGVDDDTYSNKFSYGYYVRAKNLYLINSIVPIEVGKNNQDALEGILNNGKSVYEEDTKLLNLNEILSNITMEFDGNGYYSIEYVNSTGYDFDSVSFNIKAYDSDDVEIKSTSSHLYDWKNNSKQRDKVYFSTDGAEKITIQGSYYDYMANDYVNFLTDEMELTVKNEYVIDIKLKQDLPIEVSYKSSRGSTYTTGLIDKFSYDENYWNDGEASLSFGFEGNKTYDKDGETSNSPCRFSWKLYDSEENVVDSGNVFTDNVCVGERFSKATSYASSIKPGIYYLEILDY